MRPMVLFMPSAILVNVLAHIQTLLHGTLIIRGASARAVHLTNTSMFGFRLTKKMDAFIHRESKMCRKFLKDHLGVGLKECL